MDPRALAALVFTVVVWGVAPVFLRTLSVDLGPADHLVIRYTLVTVLYVAGLALSGRWRIARRDWPRLLVISTIGLVGYNLGSAFGFALIPAGIGSLIIGTQPLLIAAMGAIIGREHLTATAVVGLIVGFCGALLLVWKDIGVSAGTWTLIAGSACIFFSGLAWSIYVVVSKPLIHKYGSFSITAMSLSICSLVMVPLLASAATVDTLVAMTVRNWFDMTYVAILSTMIASISWNYGASRLPAVASGAFLYLVPIIGVGAGALILAETITAGMLLGGTLILAGVAIAQLGPGMQKARLAAGRNRTRNEP